MGFVALLLAGTLALYAGFFYLLARALDMGTPVDALWAAMHRTWLGAAGTLVLLVVFIFLRMGEVSLETNRLVGTVVLWGLRTGVWVWVATRVYRVTRWRKGKLAVALLAGLALNLGIDFALERLSPDRAWIPSFGSWEFRLT
jgi:hypothetical protein